MFISSLKIEKKALKAYHLDSETDSDFDEMAEINA